jgi:hypothetical protein
VDNTDVDSSRLYTQPEEVWQGYETLSAVPNGNFTVAAAFGNVHGVYAPGNVPSKPGCGENGKPNGARRWWEKAKPKSTGELWRAIGRHFLASSLEICSLMTFDGRFGG